MILARINEFANATPFANSDLQDVAKLLLNFGIAVEKVITILRHFGDVSGCDKERLKELTLVFAQVSSAGKLQAQDLLQMINARVNPLQEISKITGESMNSLKTELNKRSEKMAIIQSSDSVKTSSNVDRRPKLSREAGDVPKAVDSVTTTSNLSQVTPPNS